MGFKIHGVVENNDNKGRLLNDKYGKVFEQIEALDDNSAFCVKTYSLAIFKNMILALRKKVEKKYPSKKLKFVKDSLGGDTWNVFLWLE